MSLLVAYRYAKRRESKRANDELGSDIDFANKRCTNCGYTRAQHDNTSRCPTY